MGDIKVETKQSRRKTITTEGTENTEENNKKDEQGVVGWRVLLFYLGGGTEAGRSGCSEN